MTIRTIIKVDPVMPPKWSNKLVSALASFPAPRAGSARRGVHRGIASSAGGCSCCRGRDAAVTRREGGAATQMGAAGIDSEELLHRETQ